MGVARLPSAARALLALALALSPAVATVGQPAPDFTLSDIDGNSFTLSGQRGNVVLIDFFATWCGPCKAAIPHLKELATEFPSGFIIVSITIDPDYDTVERLRQFRTDYGITWRILRDTLGISSSQYGVTAIPTLFIVDGEGVVRHMHVGDPGVTMLRSEIQPLIVIRTATQLTLSVSATSINVGTTVTISGALSPAVVGALITIGITGPDASITTLTATTGSGGSYSATFSPDRESAWRFRASYAGGLGQLPAESPEVALTASRVATQMTLSISASSVDLGSSVTLTGSFNPSASGVPLSIRVTRPDGSTTAQAITTGSGGAFSMTFTPDKDGTWKFKALYAGDLARLPSESAELTLTIEAPFPWLLVGATAVAVFTVIGAVWYLKFRRPAQPLLPPPPPPTEGPSLSIPPPPSPTPLHKEQRMILPIALTGLSLAAIALGFTSQYGTVQAFVRFLCQSCVGIG